MDAITTHLLAIANELAVENAKLNTAVTNLQADCDGDSETIASLRQQVASQPIRSTREAVTDLITASADHSMIGAIKAVRSLTGLSLYDAKSLVEGIQGCYWNRG